MTKYVDNDYYVNDYEGKIIPDDSFDDYAKQASVKIKHYTSNKINENSLDSSVKDCTCSIAEYLFNQETLKNKITTEKTISSETLGPRSVTYVNNSQYQDKQVKSPEEMRKDIKQICKEYLSPELLYRGV